LGKIISFHGSYYSFQPKKKKMRRRRRKRKNMKRVNESSCLSIRGDLSYSILEISLVLEKK
jgi:hypothetical protein